MPDIDPNFLRLVLLRACWRLAKRLSERYEQRGEYVLAHQLAKALGIIEGIGQIEEKRQPKQKKQHTTEVKE